MANLQASHEIISDKSKNAVVSTGYIKHGSEWLDGVINTAVSALNGKADKTYVDAELAKKANTEALATVDAKVNGKADANTVTSLSERVSANTTKTVDLQSQIDALVISGGGDSNTEVVQARTDASGVTHATLKTRIDTEVNGLRNKISESESRLSESIVNISDYVNLRENDIIIRKNLVKKIEVGKYARNVDGKVVLSNSESYGAVVIPVKEGYNYSMNITGELTAFSMFADTENNFVSLLTPHRLADFVYKAPCDGFMYLSNSGWNNSALDIVIFNSIVPKDSIQDMNITKYPYSVMVDRIDLSKNTKNFNGAYATTSNSKVKLPTSNGWIVGCKEVKKGNKYRINTEPTAFSYFSDFNYNSLGTVSNFLDESGAYVAPSDGYIFVSNYLSVIDNIVIDDYIASSDEPVTIIVDKKGDIKTITQACKMAKDGDTVFIKAGIYNETLHLFGKNIHLIGENRNSTIICDSKGEYANPPLEMNIGSITNLTIEETYDGERTDDAYAYCIHTESTSGIGDGASFVIDNCILKNKRKACYGLGFSENQTVIIRNSQFIIDFESDVSHTGSPLSPFLWHTSVRENVKNQHLIVQNSTFWSKSSKAMVMGNLGVNGELDYTFTNNYFYADGGTPNDNSIISVDDRHPTGAAFSKNRDCYGNNVQLLNY